MRIALLTTEYLGQSRAGGIGTYNYHLARGLAEIGIEPHVIVPSESRREPVVAEGVHVHAAGTLDVPHVERLLPTSGFALRRSIAVSEYFCELAGTTKFDLIDVSDNLAPGLFNALAGAFPMCVRLHTPHFILVENGFYNKDRDFDSYLVGLAEQLCLKRADAVIGSSEFLMENLNARCGLEDKRRFIVRNPIVFRPLTRKYDAANGATRFLFAGRFEKLKGVEILLQAFAKAVSGGADIRLTLAGLDTQSAAGGSVKDELQKLANDLGLSEKVRFRNKQDYDEIWRAYDESDASVVPSLYDNAPYACLEPMLAGLPVIGTTNGGMAEYIGDDRGLIAKSGDVGELADAILKLHADPLLREKLGRNAHDYAVKVCAHTQSARESLKIYEEILALRAADEIAAGQPDSKAAALQGAVSEAKQALLMLESYWQASGIEQLEVSAYDRGYQSGLLDGKTDGYQRGQNDAIYSHPLVTAIFRMRNLAGRS